MSNIKPYYGQGKKWALVDENKHNITKYVYDSIFYLTEKLFEVCKKGKYGIIDDNGKLITDIKYSCIQKINEHCFVVATNGYWGLINDKGDVILPIIYDNIYSIPYQLKEKSYIKIWKNGKTGIVDDKGNIIVPIIYDFIPYNMTVNKENSVGLFKIYVKYNNDTPEKYKFGYIDTNSNIIIEPKYKLLDNFCQYYFVAELYNENIGIIDIHENQILPFKFQQIWTRNNGLILTKSNKGLVFKKLLWQLFKIDDENIKEIGCFHYDEMEPQSDTIIKVTKNSLYGLINSNGDMVLPILYDYIVTHNEVKPFFIIKQNHLYGLADEYGNICIPVQYELLRKVSSNLVRVKRNGKYGICDLQGNEVVPCIYEKVYNAKDDRIAVYKDNKWGFFDNNGNLVIDFIYDEVESFSHQVTSVVKDGQRYFLDIQGNFITQKYYGETRFQSHQ